VRKMQLLARGGGKSLKNFTQRYMLPKGGPASFFSKSEKWSEAWRAPKFKTGTTRLNDSEYVCKKTPPKKHNTEGGGRELFKRRGTQTGGSRGGTVETRCKTIERVDELPVIGDNCFE